MEENNEIFTYTYSARQQEEVRRILQKYTPPQEDKMELLRRLDKSAQQPGTIAGIALGVCGTLMLGLGMCCTMVWTGVFALGVAVGCTGIAVLALAYPMFLHLTKRRRAQLAPQIEAPAVPFRVSVTGRIERRTSTNGIETDRHPKTLWRKGSP